MSRPRKDAGRATLGDVREYWNAHPLYSYEIGPAPGTAGFFDEVDRIKRQDVERFTAAYWAPEQCRGKRVLDIGCGPGWLAAQYARHGARVTAIDLTERAVALTRQHLRHVGVGGVVLQANAEDLPFADESFDRVVSSGVLHHAPDTERAIREACRVTRRDGDARITLYRKGIVHGPLVFPLARRMMTRVGIRHPGADFARDGLTPDEFIRMYDGAGNPVGRGYRDREAVELFRRCGFRVVRREVHFFPVRFVPLRLARFTRVHRWLDRWLGTMLYATLVRARER